MSLVLFRSSGGKQKIIFVPFVPFKSLEALTRVVVFGSYTRLWSIVLYYHLLNILAAGSQFFKYGILISFGLSLTQFWHSFGTILFPFN